MKSPLLNPSETALGPPPCYLQTNLPFLSQPILSGLKQSIQDSVKATPLEGVVPGPPQLLLVLPALAFVVGVTGIASWVRKTARTLDEKKRLATTAAQKKTN